MKIIKEGKPIKITFHCDECGCIFELHKKDLDYSKSRVEITPREDKISAYVMMYTTCPCCKEEVWTFL